MIYSMSDNFSGLSNSDLSFGKNMCRPENSFYIIVLLFSLLGAKNVNMEDEEWKNPHCISSVLKMYLNELPTCVFTEEKYLSFVRTFKGK